MPDGSFVEDLQAAALDALSLGVIVTDRAGRVLYANEAGQQVLAAPRSALRLRSGRIDVTDPTERPRLGASIANACSQDCAAEHLLVPSRGNGSPELALCVMPAGQASHAVVLVRIIERECNLEVEARRLFGLTKTEAKFASALAGGLSLNDAAKAHSVSLETARSHMKSIFRKTGVCRQSQLAALLRGVQIPIQSHRPWKALEASAVLPA